VSVGIPRDATRRRAGGRLGALAVLDARSGRLSTILFVVVVSGGLAFRLVALRTSVAQQNADSAVVYLMARHAAHGDWRVFLWGQFYGGTLLQLTAGALFRVIGSSFAALQVVEIGYWLGACLLLRSVVATAAGRVAGNLAGAFFWLGAPLLFTISFSDGGFYGDGLVIALAAIRIAQGAGRRPGSVRSFAIGLCLGLALWTYSLALVIALPAAVWLCVRIRSVRAALACLGGLVIGAAPWLYETKVSGFATLRTVYGPPGIGPGTRFLRVFTQIVPAAAGFGPASTWGKLVGISFLVVAVVGIGVAAWRRNVPLLVLSASALTVPIAIVASHAWVFPGAARYATYLLPGVAAILGWALSRTRGLAVLGGCAVVLISAWTITTVWNASNSFAAVPDPAVGRPASDIGAWLERKHRAAIWADYGIAYLIAAATQERVTAGDFDPRREESYLNAAAAAPRTTVVILPGMTNEKSLRALPRLPRHSRTLIDGWAVWAFDSRVDVGSHLESFS
jgi:hypothetical protein